MSEDYIFRIKGGSIYVHSVPLSGGSIYIHGTQEGDGFKDVWKKVKGIGKDVIKELKKKAKEDAKEKAKIVASNLMDKYLSEDKKFHVEKIFPQLKIDKASPRQKEIVRKIEETAKNAGEDPAEIERRANLFAPQARQPETVGLGIKKPKRQATPKQLAALEKARLAKSLKAARVLD